MGEHFDEDTVFPFIAQAIDDICALDEADYADRDQIVTYLTAIDEKKGLIKDGSAHWSDDQLYENMVDWWSACWTSQAQKILPYVARYEQLRVQSSTEKNRRREIWAYRPRA